MDGADDIKLITVSPDNARHYAPFIFQKARLACQALCLFFQFFN
jgi:hypothetical protein